jgi:hypothetical protein
LPKPNAAAWGRNFKRFLYMDVDTMGTLQLADASKALHGCFSRLQHGKNPSGEAQLFYRLRNAAVLMLSQRFHKDAKLFLDAAYRIGVAKNHDYGINNIPNYGVIGLVIRLGDKVLRAENLLGGTAAAVKDEKLKDTLIDIVNYATYAIMLCNKTWS